MEGLDRISDDVPLEIEYIDDQGMHIMYIFVYRKAYYQRLLYFIEDDVFIDRLVEGLFKDLNIESSMERTLTKWA